MTMATNKVRPNRIGSGGSKIGAIASVATIADPTAQATLPAWTAAMQRRQKGAAATDGVSFMRQR